MDKINMIFANKNKNIMYSNRILRCLIESWMFNPDKTFLSIYKTFAYNNLSDQFYAGGVKHGVSSGDIERAFLKGALQLSSTNVTAQIYLYVYENIFKNYNNLSQAEKTAFQNLKNIFLQGVNINNDQILKIIRQAIAHNNDLMADPNYNYDIKKEKFVFHLKDSLETKITISNEELIKVISLYINNIKTIPYEDFQLEIWKEKNKNILHLRQKSTGEIIEPDNNQLKVLQFLTGEIKNGHINENQKVLLLYPFKNSSFVNLLKLLDLQVIINNLYKYRTKTFREFMEVLCDNKKISLSRFEHLTHSGDILSLFDSNLLFQVFSTSKQDGMQEVLSSISTEIDINKVRNAIMHGTYFYDRDQDIVFYDERKKDEKILKNVGKMSLEQIKDFQYKFLRTKLLATKDDEVKSI